MQTRWLFGDAREARHEQLAARNANRHIGVPRCLVRPNIADGLSEAKRRLKVSAKVAPLACRVEG
jgi:hypothetical protein